MKIGSNGIKLIIKYRDTLGISTGEAVEILLRNKTTQLLLSQEKVLGVTGDEYNLELLLSATLIRERGNRNRLMKDEKELLEGFYKFKIGNKELDDEIIELNCNENKKVEQYIERFDKNYKFEKKVKTGSFGGRMGSTFEHTPGIAAKVPFVRGMAPRTEKGIAHAEKRIICTQLIAEEYKRIKNTPIVREKYIEPHSIAGRKIEHISAKELEKTLREHQKAESKKNKRNRGYRER